MAVCNHPVADEPSRALLGALAARRASELDAAIESARESLERT